MIRKAIPSIITMIGLVLSLAWIFGAPWWIGAIGLICDKLDGQAARHLGVESKFGSLLDWSTDVLVLAALFVHTLGVWPVVAILLPAQVYLRRNNTRFSGRAMFSILVMVWQAAA